MFTILKNWWIRWRGQSPIVTVAVTTKPEIPPIAAWTLDDRSAKNISSLDGKTAKLATELLRRLHHKGYTFKAIDGFRSREQQDRLYAQGRTTAGKIVTKAKGGYSWHNFGLAFDIALFDGKTIIWDSPAYTTAGKIGEEIGLKWGGRFKTLVDKPHFERPNGRTLAQMRVSEYGKTRYFPA